ncbi:hypothetical protein RB195_005775 [Necator americanus]|uniref:Uncharacterized protein n=1 Tax=Necator americanus TaxID=51031 RepID=A0ABR1BRD6_NECAM
MCTLVKPSPSTHSEEQAGPASSSMQGPLSTISFVQGLLTSLTKVSGYGIFSHQKEWTLIRMRSTFIQLNRCFCHHF